MKLSWIGEVYEKMEYDIWKALADAVEVAAAAKRSKIAAKTGTLDETRVVRESAAVSPQEDPKVEATERTECDRM